MHSIRDRIDLVFTEHLPRDFRVPIGDAIGIYLDELNIQAVEIEAGKSGGFRVRREASVPMPQGTS